MTKEQMDAIWRAPGVAQAGHLTAWHVAQVNGKARLIGRPGAPRKPTWDKALLKRARRLLPNWHAMRNDPYHH